MNKTKCIFILIIHTIIVNFHIYRERKKERGATRRGGGHRNLRKGGGGFEILKRGGKMKIAKDISS